MGIAIPQVITPSKASGAQVIDGSLKFDNTKSNYLSRTPGASGNKRIWTWSSWIKRTKFGANGRILRINPSGESGIQFSSDDKLELYHYQDSSYTFQLKTTQVLRDTGWYHIVIAFDTTQSTSTDRVKFYINGTQVTSFSTSSYPSEDFESYFNLSSAHSIFGSDLFPAGYVSQVNWIDGAALGPENFGFTDPLTNTWKPKKYTGTFAIASGTPSVANGGLVIKADGASINGTFGVGGSVKTWTSPDGVTWTRDGSGRTGSAAKYLAVGGAGTALRTFYPDAGSGGFSFYMYNGGGEFDGTSTPFTLDLSSQTYLPSQTSSFGDNGFYLPLDGNSPIGKDMSGNGNDWTPVNFGGSNSLEKATGAKPILNTTPGGTQAGVGVFGSKQNVGYAVTVYNDGGGNKYYIDGVKQDTVTGLIRGATYTFDTSDSTVSSHPFRFSATSNGSHGGGSEYTNGVAAITGAATTITVPHDAPNTLYYYCTSHSGMGADITGITTNEKLADQYASNCVLALPLVGIDDDVCASIACTSTTKVITANGDPTASTTQSNFYGASYLFDGSGDYLSTPDSADYAMGTDDWTVEMWIQPTASSQNSKLLFAHTSGGDFGWCNLYFGSGILKLYCSSNGSSWTVSNIDIGTPLVNKWSHIAVSRSGSTFRTFFNGVHTGSATSSDSLMDSTGTLQIGARNGTETYTGYIQDVRIYKGVAKYTSDFIPASTSPDILPDTPSGVSGGSKLTKITDGAVAFDGSGDNLTIPWSTDFELGTGDFTIEYYGYSRNNGTAITWGADINNRFDLGSITEGNVRFFCRSSSSTFIELDADVATEKWAHIAAD